MYLQIQTILTLLGFDPMTCLRVPWAKLHIIVGL
jgi:hypothetical protein